MVRAADPEPLYKTKYRVINIHRHCDRRHRGRGAGGAGGHGPRRHERRDDPRRRQPGGNLDAWIKLQQKFPDRLVVFWKPSFAKVKEATFFTDLVHELETAARMGVRGVKIWKDLGMYIRDSHGTLLKADDPRLDPFWEKCGELGLPVLIHVADEREYWYPLTPNSIHYGLRAEQDQHYNNPDMPTWEELIRQRDAVLKAHPKTTFIGAHMGSLSLDLKRLGETFDKYPNFFVDTASRQRILGRLNPPAVRDFFVKYQDRILFGTDDLVLFKGRNRPAVWQHLGLPDRRPGLADRRPGRRTRGEALAGPGGIRLRPVFAVLRDRPAGPDRPEPLGRQLVPDAGGETAARGARETLPRQRRETDPGAGRPGQDAVRSETESRCGDLPRPPFARGGVREWSRPRTASPRCAGGVGGVLLCLTCAQLVSEPLSHVNNTSTDGSRGSRPSGRTGSGRATGSCAGWGA